MTENEESQWGFSALLRGSGGRKTLAEQTEVRLLSDGERGVARVFAVASILCWLSTKNICF